MVASRILSRGCFGLAAALLLASSASALDITGLAINTTGTNSANSFNDNVTKTQVASSTSITLNSGGPVADTLGSSLSVQTRYAWLVAADRENPGSQITQSATAAYQITFTVSNPTGATYQIDIDTLRLGSLSWVDDTTGNSTLTLGAMTATVDGSPNATLGLPSVGPTANSATTTTAINQDGTTYSIVSSALSQSFTLAFTWAGSSATSNNDEAAIRMGIAGSLTNVTADDYPGSPSGDGHFVNVSATIISATVPEPGPGALLGLGLVALALLRRRARE